MEKFGGREFIWSGKGEDPDFSKIDDYKFRDPETLELSPELKERIEKIDMEALRDIFIELASEYDVEPDRVNFIEKENLNGTSGYGVASYSVRENKIGISPGNIKIHAERKEISEDIYFFHILVHEETHAISHVACTYTDIRLKIDKPLRKVGFSEYSNEARDEEEVYEKERTFYFHDRSNFERFNEGVTDLIADEVVRKYIKKTSTYSEEDIVEFYKNLDTGQERKYILLVVEGFIDRLSKATGEEKGEIWNMIKGAYIQGDSLLQGEFREYLNTTLGTDYMEALRNGKILPVEKKERGLLEKIGRNMKAFIIKTKRKM